MIAETLKKLAANGSDAGQRIKPLAGPWIVEAGGKELAVATDGRAMLWATEIPPATAWQTDETAKQKLLSLFDPPPCDKTTGTLNNLKTFLGKPIWAVECPACKGTSKVSDYVSCTFCEGEGVMQSDSMPGIVCGVRIDRNRLACLLEPFVDDAEIIICHGARPGNNRTEVMVWVLGETFRAVLAQMTPDMADEEVAAEWENAPSFP